MCVSFCGGHKAFVNTLLPYAVVKIRSNSLKPFFPLSVIDLCKFDITLSIHSGDMV